MYTPGKYKAPYLDMKDEQLGYHTFERIIERVPDPEQPQQQQ